MAKIKSIIALGLTVCVLLIMYSMNLQKAARIFTNKGLTGCAALSYFDDISNEHTIVIKAGDILSEGNKNRIELISNEAMGDSSRLARIIYVTHSQQRLLIDTMIRYSKAALTYEFPRANIYVMFIDPPGTEIRKEIYSIINEQFGVQILSEYGDEYIIPSGWPFQYTLFINNLGRVQYGSQTVSGCMFAPYLEAFYVGDK